MHPKSLDATLGPICSVISSRPRFEVNIVGRPLAVRVSTMRYQHCATNADGFSTPMSSMTRNRLVVYLAITSSSVNSLSPTVPALISPISLGALIKSGLEFGSFISSFRMVATARWVFPVPHGPNNRIDFSGEG